MTRRFARKGERLVMTLSEPERALLAHWLPDELRTVYEGTGGDDAARGRLFPVAYLDPTEESAESEWQALVHPELLRARLEALTTLAGTLERATPGRRGALVVELGPEDVPALLGVLNDARLALGTVLGVTEENDLDTFDPDDPQGRAAAIYAWLTHLEGELVDTLLGELPD